MSLKIRKRRAKFAIRAEAFHGPTFGVSYSCPPPSSSSFADLLCDANQIDLTKTKTAISTAYVPRIPFWRLRRYECVPIYRRAKCMRDFSRLQIPLGSREKWERRVSNDEKRSRRIGPSGQIANWVEVSCGKLFTERVFREEDYAKQCREYLREWLIIKAAGRAKSRPARNN